jgi:AbrB family looped-hinge helix DNA binding protein
MSEIRLEIRGAFDHQRDFLACPKRYAIACHISPRAASSSAHGRLRHSRTRRATDLASVCHTDGMKTTIDKAGRVVIPATIRIRAGLTPGTEIEVVLDDVSVRLLRRVPGPKLTRVGKRLVARPSVPARDLPRIDLAALIEEERNRWPG